MTPEQFEKRLRALERKVCCIFTPCPEPVCPISAGPCEYDTVETWPEQTGGILYSIFVSYVDLGGNINSNFISWTSNTGQTPQEFLDDLNANYNPNIVFTLNEDGSVHIVAQDFAAACYLEAQLQNTVPNVDTLWGSANSVNINGIQSYDGADNNQGSFDGATWGNNGGPTNSSVGYMAFDSNTEKLTFTYDAAIPSGVSAYVHIVQNGIEITGSPFFVSIPSSGTGTFDVTGLSGLLDNTYDLLIVINDDSNPFGPPQTVNYEEDTGGSGSPDFFNNLFDIPVEPGQTIYFQGEFTINTEVGFQNGASWIIGDMVNPTDAEFNFDYILVNGSDDSGAGGINGYSSTPPFANGITLSIKGSVTNVGGSTSSIKFQAYSTDSYFGGTYDNLFLTGSTYTFGTIPF